MLDGHQKAIARANYVNVDCDTDGDLFYLKGNLDSNAWLLSCELKQEGYDVISRNATLVDNRVCMVYTLKKAA